MIVGFLTNRLTIRGTEVALYDYAEFNETLLENTSIVIARPYDTVQNMVDTSKDVYDKFAQRFPVYFYSTKSDIERILTEQKIDVLYIIKGGNYDDLFIENFKTIVHCVFDTRYPHGTIYTPISEHLNESNNTQYPVLPHMVRIHDTHANFRHILNIPADATVFGTYSGENEFNIEYIKQAVIDISTNSEHDMVYFIFMNIIPFAPSNKRLIFLPGTPSLEVKRAFINTCDAMLYGRGQGETFGLSCGEFSMCNKPIIARTLPYFYGTISTFHLDTLKNDIIVQNSYDELFHILTHWNLYKKDVSQNGYKKYTPEYVMNIFKNMLTAAYNNIIYTF